MKNFILSFYTIHCSTKPHYLIAPIEVESRAKLRMTFCRIAQVFNDSHGTLRVPNFTLPCKIGMLSATPEGRHATPS